MKVLGTVEIPGGLESAAAHSINGIAVGPAFKLEVVQFQADAGFYLLRLDSEGRELTDTLHDSVFEALDQAQFEYGIAPEAWRLTGRM